MLDYRPTKLQKHDDNITLAWRSDTGASLDYKMRLSGWSTSYIIAYVQQTAKYIVMGRQEDIIEAYNALQNGGEIEFLRSAQRITPTQINAYAGL